MLKKQFEKLTQKVCNAENRICGKLLDCDIEHTEIKSMIESVMSKWNSMSKIIESQQRTIEQLTNALKDKYEHGLFVFSEDCKIPMVIRNGKELTNDMTSYFGIDWSHGETPNIRIEQFAGTCSDSER